MIRNLGVQSGGKGGSSAYSVNTSSEPPLNQDVGIWESQQELTGIQSNVLCHCFLVNMLRYFLLKEWKLL